MNWQRDPHDRRAARFAKRAVAFGVVVVTVCLMAMVDDAWWAGGIAVASAITLVALGVFNDPRIVL